MAPNTALMDKIQQGGFLPLALTLDPLQNILIEIMNMIHDQNSQIESLKDQLANKADQSTVNELSDKVDKNDTESQSRDKELNDKVDELSKQIDELKQHLDETDCKVETNRQNNEKTGRQLEEIQKQVDPLENRITKAEETVKSAADKIANHDKELSEAAHQLNDTKKRVNNITMQADRTEKALKSMADDIVGINGQIVELGGKTQLDPNYLQSVQDSLSSQLNLLGSQIDLLRTDSMAKFNQIDDINKTTTNKVGGLESSFNELSRKLEDIPEHSPLVRPPSSGEGNRPPRNPSSSGNRDDMNNEFTSRDGAFLDVPQLGEDGNGSSASNRADSVHSSSRKSNVSDGIRKSPLPDLPPADLNDAIQALRKQLTQLTARVNDNETHANTKFADIDEKLKQIFDRLDALNRELESRPDRLFIERLFDKFKTSMNTIADQISKKSVPENSNFATLEDIKRVENTVKQMNMEFEETAAARKSTCCLSCGRPYRMVTGAIQDEQTLAVLGAAPIVHLAQDNQKPCFVYGSDKELYYAQTPRGRTFVAPNPRNSTAKPASS